MPVSGIAKTQLFGGVVLTLLVALGAALTDARRTREEMQSVISANMSLRNTLGEMAKAITDKTREIDRLSRVTCVPQSGSPNPQTVPGRKSALP